MKKRWLLLVCIFIVSGLKIHSINAYSEEDWIEQSINPNLKTELADYYLHYTYGMSGHQNKGVGNAPTGIPNVYLEDKQTGKLIQHIYGFSNNTLSSSSFMLGLKNPTTNKYEVFSSLYTNSKIYTRGNEIRATTNKTVTGYGSYRYDSYLIPKSAERINHKFVITNTGNKALTFRAMKNVDTELDNNDAIPVLMYGYNEGLYMGTDTFSVIYDFNLPYGPTNFTNYYKTYRAPTTDTLNHSVFYPYNPANITGSGAEALGYLPNESVAGTPSDTGIYMKWDEKTILPGESVIFEYDVVLSTAASSEYTMENQNTTTGINYVEDVLTYKHNIQVPLTTVKLNSKESYMEEKIPEGFQFSNPNIYIKNSQDMVKRSVPISDVYNETTGVLKIPLQTEDIENFEILIEYDLIPTIELANQTVTHKVNYKLDVGLTTYSWVKQLLVPIDIPEAGDIEVVYIDESNNLLMLKDNTSNPLQLSGKYGESYETQEKEIDGFEFSTVVGNPEGTFNRKEQTISYIYKKKKYLVQFNSNGGNNPENQEVLYQEKIIKPTDPTYQQRTFLGWYTDANLTQKYDFLSEVTNDIELFAKWQTGIYTPDGQIVDGKEGGPFKDMLRIQHVSDFDFGTVNNTTSNIFVQSFADKFKENEVAPFISIIDDRPEPLISSWRLTATRDEFSTVNKQNELSGSKLILSNVEVLGIRHEGIKITSNQLPIGVSEETLICETENPLSFSSYSIIFGQLNEEGITNGVTLNIPESNSKKSTSYTSTINWNIVTGGP